MANLIVEKIGIFDKLISQTKGSVIFYVGNDIQWNGTILVHQDTKVTAEFQIALSVEQNFIVYLGK